MGYYVMKNEDLKEKVKDLTLMQLQLTSWEESEFGMQYCRSWKGYDFGVLNELTDEGAKKATELLKQYGIEGG